LEGDWSTLTASAIRDRNGSVDRNPSFPPRFAIEFPPMENRFALTPC
jgi:hypothetical protein